jgi:exodeoxyribonuclease VII large subunit
MTTGKVVRSVSWLVNRISAQIDMADDLQNVRIEAEILNFHNTKGHWYFSLKDEFCRIDCAMWRSDNQTVRFIPENGDRVLVLGSVTVYKVQGRVQLTVRRMARAGEGDLKARFDALYRKLDEEGLFALSHKKPIPQYPMHIALVTGSSTHARADVLNTLDRRWPVARITEFPALVQGENAPAELIAALKKADRAEADIVLLCRGGGSMEDLWCFNDELLARTIYAMDTPVITGVGHEPDYTLVDYVADLRAPTPTGAAEQASPDIREVRQDIANTRVLLRNLMNRRITMEQDRIAQITHQAWYADPESLIYSRRMEKHLVEERFLHLLHTVSARMTVRLNESRQAIVRSVNDRITSETRSLAEDRQKMMDTMDRYRSDQRKELARREGLLDAYSPLKVLSRGYSVVTKDEHVVSEASALKSGDAISIRMHKGTIEAAVTGVTGEE